jgi:hypothetical protein
VLVVYVYKYKWCPQSYNHEKERQKKMQYQKKKECASAAFSILQNFGLHLHKNETCQYFVHTNTFTMVTYQLLFEKSGIFLSSYFITSEIFRIKE